MNKPPPRPRVPAEQQRSRKLIAYVTPAIYEEVTNRARVKGTGWSISKEAGQLIGRALEAEPAAPKPDLSTAGRVRDIMRDRGVTAETARLLADAEAGRPAG